MSSEFRDGWRPKVTALVPCYNAAAFIGRTLDSLAAQTWANLEILIGDDRSTDDTLAVVRAFAAGRDDVRIVTRERNLGWLANSNDLMARAAGELMFFAFHDDLVAPDYVEKLVGALRRRPGAIMAFSDLEEVELDGSSRIVTYEALDGLTSPFARGFAMARHGHGWWAPNRGVFRAEAFRRIGGIRPNDRGEYSADWTWLLHMATLGEFVRVPEVLCRKFYKPGSLSKTWARDAGQRAALRGAGIREVRASPLGPLGKAVIVGYLWRRDRLPPGVNRALRRALGLAGG